MFVVLSSRNKCFKLSIVFSVYWASINVVNKLLAFISFKLLNYTGQTASPLCKKKIEKIVSCDTWHVTCGVWRVTHDMWHVTYDRWQVGGGEPPLTISALVVLELEVTYDTWHGTPDMWHLTLDKWHMTCVTWNTEGDEHCVRISGP